MLMLIAVDNTDQCLQFVIFNIGFIISFVKFVNIYSIKI